MYIGLDFDNTIIGYNHIFHALAEERGWISASTNLNKRDIRDTIRLVPDGETKWAALQAEVYGPQITKATLMPGVADFLRTARQQNIPLAIISHKSRYAAAAPNGPDLREAALDWMKQQNFFTADGFGLNPAKVYFADTRTEKCQRIAALGCTHFVDDLEEVLRDPAFPNTVKGILYHPAADVIAPGPFAIMHDWESITHACFKQSAA